MENEVNQMRAPYSPRSQRSVLEEDRLQGNLGKIDDLIQHTERKIAELEKDKARTLKRIPTGKVDQVFLSRTLADLEDNRRKLAAYKEERASAEKVIAQLAPTSGALAARAKEQQRLAQLAAERLEKDRQVNDLVGSLRQALQERTILTATMKESIATLDFAADDGLLDAQRFDELVVSLPEDLLARSEDQNGWFLGKQKNVKPYIVRARRLVIPETLANHGVYRLGDRIELPEKEVRELMREDRRAPTRNAPWRRAHPSIMTVEAWDTATTSAAEHGITVLEILLWEDWQRDAKNKKSYRADGQVDIPPTEDSDDFVTIKVEAKRKINLSSGAHDAGDVFEFRIRERQGSEMFRDGDIARP